MRGVLNSVKFAKSAVSSVYFSTWKVKKGFTSSPNASFFLALKGNTYLLLFLNKACLTYNFTFYFIW
ncbi:hypothetical protein C0J52_16254 [Blattella germanica]|nr:hypothetical protein C0J52_16254 [Blattella germanica]